MDDVHITLFIKLYHSTPCHWASVNEVLPETLFNASFNTKESLVTDEWLFVMVVTVSIHGVIPTVLCGNLSVADLVRWKNSSRRDLKGETCIQFGKQFSCVFVETTGLNEQDCITHFVQFLYWYCVSLWRQHSMVPRRDGVIRSGWFAYNWCGRWMVLVVSGS